MWNRRKVRQWLIGVIATGALQCREARREAESSVSPLLASAREIAFGRFTDGRLYDIFVVTEDGLGLQNLTDHPANDINPRWSPDGSLIAFESSREGYPNIFVVPAHGGAARNFSRVERGARECDWFPDSRRIVFQGEALTGNDLYVATITDSNLVNLTNGVGINLYPRCSPDGRTIAFVSDRDGAWGLYVMSVDSLSPKRLADITGFDVTFTLKWSPDGARLLYNFAATTGARDVFVIGKDGAGRKNLTNDPSDDVGGDWSPQGDAIVFQSDRVGRYAIFWMDAEGGNVRKMSTGEGDSAPSFSPDGLKVMFLSTRRGAHEIWLVNPGGFQESIVAPTSISDLTPRWKP